MKIFSESVKLDLQVVGELLPRLLPSLKGTMYLLADAGFLPTCPVSKELKCVRKPEVKK